jgi:hypothetical protein
MYRFPIHLASHIVVSEQYILDMISTFDANKAVGPDIISNTMLIAVKVQISKQNLTEIYTIIYFPVND